MRLDQLEPFEIRISERRRYTRDMPEGSTQRVTVDADTEMLEQLVNGVRSLAIANQALREIVEELRVALAARPVVHVASRKGGG